MFNLIVLLLKWPIKCNILGCRILAKSIDVKSLTLLSFKAYLLYIYFSYSCHLSISIVASMLLCMHALVCYL